MTLRQILSAFVVTALGIGITTVQAAAQSAKDLIGAWSLVSTDAYGPNPMGSYMFDANGRFSAILMRNDLPKYASNNRTTATPAEYKTTVDGSLGYFGTWSISGTDLNLHVLGSTYPNWTGTDQKRTNISITGDEFKYTVPAPSGGGAPNVTVWKRVK